MLEESQRVNQITQELIKRIALSKIEEQMRKILNSLAEIGLKLYFLDHDYKEFDKNVKIIEDRI